jgi:hypothetical protein
MKNVFLIASLILASCSVNQKKPEAVAAPQVDVSPVAYANTITATELSDYLYTYASDEFEGRETGQPGQKKAAEYLKAQYIKMGIKAAKADGDYFQEVPLITSGAPDASLSINGVAYTLGSEFATFASSKEGTTTANEIVYAGYGITVDNYNDYENIDVTDKIVLIKAGEPKGGDGNYIISGTDKTSKWSNIRQAFGEKTTIAKDNGAKGILVYDQENLPRILQQFEYIKKSAENGSGRISLKGEADSFFYFFINDKLAKSIHPNIEKSSDAKSIATKLAVTFKEGGKDIMSENVVSMIKGSEKPEEYIVISGHLDHEGIKNGEVYNGADDDGSGTVSILEIAQAFKKAQLEGNGPKRSIVFLHVTGEEKGLLGSEYYTDNPIFPLTQTVADLNIDMIGRSDPKRKEGSPNYVYLIGSDKLSTELHELSEAVNKKYVNIELDYTYNDENDPNRFYYRSDHYNFAKHNVPIIFYFNGTHDDYHKPSDTPDKIEYELMANRAKLVFYTAWELANIPNRIVADKAVAPTE